MNRRRFLIALAIIIPLVLFGVAKNAASWRPVKVGRLFTSRAPAPVYDFEIQASRHYVIAGGFLQTIFDLRTGEARTFAQGVSGDRAGLREFSALTQRQLRVYGEDGQPRFYDLPASIYLERDETQTPWITAPRDNVSIAAPRDAAWIELFWESHYYRWDESSRKMTRSREFIFGKTCWEALSRDGETLICAGYKSIERFSTRTAHQIGSVALVGLRPSLQARMSAFGSYALYDSQRNGITHWRVVDTASGRIRWNFDLEGQQFNAAALSSDETIIALPLASRKRWEIRELRTGNTLRTLPLVPGAQIGTFSPDGATLYSIANGVLYRQRAR